MIKLSLTVNEELKIKQEVRIMSSAEAETLRNRLISVLRKSSAKSILTSEMATLSQDRELSNLQCFLVGDLQDNVVRGEETLANRLSSVLSLLAKHPKDCKELDFLDILNQRTSLIKSLEDKKQHTEFVLTEKMAQFEEHDFVPVDATKFSIFAALGLNTKQIALRAEVKSLLKVIRNRSGVINAEAYKSALGDLLTEYYSSAMYDVLAPYLDSPYDKILGNVEHVNLGDEAMSATELLNELVALEYNRSKRLIDYKNRSFRYYEVPLWIYYV